jgi:hypothetical protein
MTKKSLFAVLIVALTVAFSSLTASAQQPRAIPSNDNVASAKAIKIGKTYFTPDIGAATTEVGEPGVSCLGSQPIPNSVWFTFTLPESATVSLSTYGSALIHDEYDSVDTVLAVYAFTAPFTYTEVACEDNSNGIPSAQLVFQANGGTVYYVAAGSANNTDWLPTSTLKLTTRMLATLVRPLNDSFEDPITDPGWTVKNADTDGIVCLDATYAALSGDCAFKFTGTAATTTKLRQTVAFPTEFKARKNALIKARFYVEVLDTAALANTKIKLIVFYSDGTPKSVRTLNLDGLAALGSYQVIEMYNLLRSAKVQAIKFQTNFGEATGTLMLDGLHFEYQSDVATRGLLPVPPAAQ